MKNTLSNLFIFAAGAAIGSAVTYKLVKAKYERVVEEEADAYRAALAKREREDKDVSCDNNAESAPDEEPDEEGEFDVYRSKLSELGYVSTAEVDSNKPKEVKNVRNCKIIAPEECGECDGYDVVELTYYADGVLTDDKNKVIEDVDEVIGKESLNHFGDYEPDTVYVRDAAKRVDYVILRDEGTYSDVVKNKLHLAEDE